MGVEVSEYGVTSKGERVHLYYLYNDFMELYLTDLGATLINVWVRDKVGRYRDVVLGYDDAASYEINEPSLGSTVGRNANRIGGSHFRIDDLDVHLTANEGCNNLHSGPEQYKYRVWEAWTDVENDEASVTFLLSSPDGDQGYPGNAKISVTYTLTINNGVRIDYKAKADADTVFNMTNHSYFNLDGSKGGSVLEHSMWIDADSYLELTSEGIPTGSIVPVNGTPMDFRQEKVIGEQMDMNYKAIAMAKGYDHNYVLNNGGKMALCASLYSPASGILMEVYTDRPGLQIYTANYLIDEKGKEGRIYQPREAVCFETQAFPDAPNHSNFPSSIVRKGEVYRTSTLYEFSKR